MFFVFKLKTVLQVAGALILTAAISLSAIFLVPNAVQSMTTSGEYTVVLDAGHGGIDAGVIGIDSKVKESEINLQIVRRVQRILKRNNINVVLTREDENGLYGGETAQFKRRDMAARKAIIEKTAPNIMVSIHCNKFPDKTRRGAQVFFEELSAPSKALADSIQATVNMLNAESVQRTFSALKGDYYMLNCTKYPSAIVECGFLSNPEDDKLLNDKAYQEKIAYQIFSGIIGFFVTSQKTGQNAA